MRWGGGGGGGEGVCMLYMFIYVSTVFGNQKILSREACA